jgi:hypothetical protein
LLLAGLLGLLLLLAGLLRRLLALLLTTLGLLLTTLGLLLTTLGLLLASLRRSLLLQELGQILELGDHAHAAFLIARIGQRTRAFYHLLDILLALGIHLRLCKLLLDLIEPLRALLLLRQCRCACEQHEPTAGEQSRA